MKNSIICLLFFVMLLGFFQNISGQDKTFRRAFLVGIGNYVDSKYNNPFSQLGFGAESGEYLGNFDRFCDTNFAACQTFLENTGKLSGAAANDAPAEIRTFYDFLKANPNFANKTNWFADYILYRRAVYNSASINLEKGPHNDVLNMTRILTLKYEFDEIYILLEPGALRDQTEQILNKIQTEYPKTKIKLLKDVLPTNDGIQKAFKESLIKPTCNAVTKNCKSVFYFSGHGSQRKNPSEDDGFEETLVTLDAVSGKPDLRDDELAKLYAEALEKVDLTVITDSCHSGDNYKFPLRDVIPKTISDDPRPVPDAEPPNKLDPVEKGLLFFAASRTNETAGSNSALDDLFDNPGGQSQQGIFTHHFVKTLLSVNDTTAREVFERTRASMETNRQQPVARGLRDNQNTNFFGVKVDPKFISISDIKDGVFYIVGGRLQGLQKGIQLKSDRVCLIVDGVDLQRSTAKECPDTNAANKAALRNTQVKQSTWAIPSAENALKFWVSALPPKQQIETILNKIRKNIETDPAKEISHLLYYQNNQWRLCSASACAPTQIDALSFAENDRVLFVNPPGNVEENVQDVNNLRAELSKLNFGVRLVDDLASSDYFLAGDPEKKYAWVNRNALRWRRPPTVKAPRVGDVQSVMPSNTRYVSIAFNNEKSEVVELAQNLAKMYGWITLKMFSPTPAESTIKLSAFNKDDKPVESGSIVAKGDYVRFTVPRKNKYFYLVSFNDKGVMAFENETSFDKCPEQAGERDCSIEEIPKVPENFGTKAFVLLSTDEPITNARSVLNAEGVKSIDSNPLLSLIYQMRSGQKDAGSQPTIQNWAVDSFYLKYEAKK